MYAVSLWGRPNSTSHYFSQILTPSLPLSHFVTHLGAPKVRHTSLTPQFLVVQTKPDKMPLYKISLNYSQGFLSGRFFPGWFWFVPLPLLSKYSRNHIKFNITFNFMIKKLKACASYMLFTAPPHSLCHKLSHLELPPPRA